MRMMENEKMNISNGEKWERKGMEIGKMPEGEKKIEGN